MLRHLSRSVCSIFTDRASSDLIVIVSGREHHLLRSIMIPTSHYLERFLTWSEEQQAVPTIKIDLPDVHVPEPFRTSSKVHDDWFALFVRVVYGRGSALPRRCPGDAVGVVQIADFMIAPSVTAMTT